MSRILALVLMIGISVVGVAQSQQTAPAPAEAQALIGKSQAVMQALKSKDAGTLKSLLADDFRTIASDGSTYGKGELLGAAQEGALQGFSIYDAHVMSIDDNSAIVTYNAIVTMPEGDDGFAPRYQKIADLWVRQGEDWKLKFEQSTPLRHVD